MPFSWHLNPKRILNFHGRNIVQRIWTSLLMKTTEAHAKNTENNFLMLKTLNLYFPDYLCYSVIEQQTLFWTNSAISNLANGRGKSIKNSLMYDIYYSNKQVFYFAVCTIVFPNNFKTQIYICAFVLKTCLYIWTLFHMNVGKHLGYYSNNLVQMCTHLECLSTCADQVTLWPFSIFIYSIFSAK